MVNSFRFLLVRYFCEERSVLHFRKLKCILISPLKKFKTPCFFKKLFSEIHSLVQRTSKIDNPLVHWPKPLVSGKWTPSLSHPGDTGGLSTSHAGCSRSEHLMKVSCEV